VKRTREVGDPRAIAHEVLVRVETTDAFADVLLAHRLRERALGATDRRLASELVYGTLTWQGRLDHHLSAWLHQPLAGLEPPVRAALRMGLFQLLFLDRVPPYAAVDTSVRLVDRRAAGLVNAVLRRAARVDRASLPLPDATADPATHLAVRWAHPRWLVARWIHELGLDETARLLAANDRAPRPTLRVNPRRTTREELRGELAAAGVQTEPGRFAPTALAVLEGAGRLRATEAFRRGLFSFQGEASQLATLLVETTAAARVLDACAAPGGKTLAIAERSPHSRVVAFDPNPRGLARLASEARRLGLGMIDVACADARHPPSTQRFDAVLVDAPCTGLGTLRRHPELKWRRRPEDTVRLASLQREILTGTGPLVRPGGLLVYVVCTVTRAETVEIVDWLRDSQPRFAVERVDVPGVGSDGFLRTWPHEHDLDGFFAARLRARA
jgi:16S rRNA (cytosine967-C5)-methyltransferase